MWIRYRGVVVIAAALAAFSGWPGAAQAQRPVVFVHGGAGSGAQYEAQAMRFASNGYPADRIRVHEYDSTFSINTQTEIFDGLDLLIDQLLAETGETQIDLLGHSLGTTLMQAYLNSSAERAAKVAHYINIDGRTATSPPGGVATLAIWGMGDPAREIVGAENVYFAEQTHVEVATSAESFGEQFEFFSSATPATTAILPEPQVRLSGRAVLFPENLGVDGTLHVYEIDPDTGYRLDETPEATYAVSEAGRGEWGPFDSVPGRHYEIVLLRDGARPQHFYPQPTVRSDHLVRLLTVDPSSPISTNADAAPDRSGMVITRYREFWGDQGDQNDVLEINGLDIISPTNAPISKRVNGIFVFDDDLDGMNDLVTPNAFYFGLPFITAMDVFLPGSSPPDDVLEVRSTSRNGQSAAVNVPNWASSEDIVSILLPTFTQATALVVPASKDALKCESGSAKALASFAKLKGNCVKKCLKARRKTAGPYDECTAPYAGDTAACIQGAKGAEAKTLGKIAKACVKECPACYEVADVCPDGAPFVAQVEDHIDALGLLLHCLEAEGTTPDKPQAKCEDAVAMQLVKFTMQKSKCYDKCVSKESKGKLPPGSCSTGAPSDADTQECIAKAEVKVAAAIDKACEAPGAKPACYPAARDSGAEWVAVVENLVDATLPTVYCGD